MPHPTFAAWVGWGKNELQASSLHRVGGWHAARVGTAAGARVMWSKVRAPHPPAFFASVLAVCRTWKFFVWDPMPWALSQNGDLWLNAAVNMYCDGLARIVYAMCLVWGYVWRFSINATRPDPHIMWNTCICRTMTMSAVCRCVHLAESTTFFWAEPQPMSKCPVPLAWPSVSCAALRSAHFTLWQSHCGSQPNPGGVGCMHTYTLTKTSVGCCCGSDTLLGTELACGAA